MKIVLLNLQDGLGVVKAAVADELDADRLAMYMKDSKAMLAAAPTPAQSIGDDDLRMRWRLAGGKFHGPNVETGYMPEENLLPFLRSLVAPTAPEVEPVAWLNDMGTEQKLSFVPLEGAHEHEALVRATHAANDELMEVVRTFLAVADDGVVNRRFADALLDLRAGFDKAGGNITSTKSQL